MDPTTLRLIQGAAGASGDKVYVDDVFSTFLVVGAGGQTITNGIDLATEGGMVWSKARAVGTSFAVHDTERGVNKFLSTNSTAAQIDVNSVATSPHTINSFNTNGFTTGQDAAYGYTDLNGYGNYVHWTFRKAPGFFDVVTYTGNGSAQNISHSLGSVPGMMIVKNISTVSNWIVYHRSLGAFSKLELNETGAPSSNPGSWNNTAPTASVFTIGTNNSASGDTYVAYIFAHDEPVFGTDEDESIIKCGEYTIPGSGTFDVDLGFEPQFILYKQISGGMGTPNWYMHDPMRGLSETLFNPLYANLTNSESPAVGTSNLLIVYPTGFKSLSSAHNAGNYIYMAIRRPDKPPSAATDVFSPTAYTGNQTARVVGTNLCDFAILSDLDANSPGWTSYAQYMFTRLMGPNLSQATSNNIAQVSGWAGSDALGDYFRFDVNGNNGLGITAVTGYMNNTGTNYALYNFTRSPGFMDVVLYRANNQSTQNITHNLNAEPELIIFKTKSNPNNGWVYVKNSGTDKVVSLDGNAAQFTSATWLNNTAPTSSVFTVGSGGYVNYQTWDYAAYLFATLLGISKVGSYTGTGSDLNVDCGFSAGARFILIKRSDGTGDWYVYDSSRGIVSGNDPYVLLNDDAAQVTNTDYIDPLASGFTVTSSAPTGLNAVGGTYIFLAIA